MKLQPLYYTVLIRTISYLVRYAIAPACEVQEFTGAFTDPAHATREFKAAIGHDFVLVPLTPSQFEKQVGKLAQAYHAEQARLASWRAMAAGGAR